MSNRLGHQTNVIEALPTFRRDIALAADSSKPGNTVLFLGAFEDRKGVLELVDAWPAVRAAAPSAELIVVGKGPLEPEVRRRVAEMKPAARVVVDPPRSEIFSLLADAKVVVLLSKRELGWREQVGLPICEGLASGCEIVTTGETGLAEWLASNGHRVIPEPSTDSIVDALAAAIFDERLPQEIIESLPLEDGRLIADRWMTCDDLEDCPQSNLSRSGGRRDSIPKRGFEKLESDGVMER
ncbi:glycosyltransferase family 4 protein [Gordonia mangrovi]|uniref:glycosyltransferase family 4 protein n=1 Tax=Gordonia mangrovi TaxID=2665643 RepID=UPI0013710F54|nr:glycosyltransferase family 4 protein [Gordonia mangrovi]UVF79141.1 glycosyltransferase family 4 protein [Gordonia mangrovi]